MYNNHYIYLCVDIYYVITVLCTVVFTFMFSYYIFVLVCLRHDFGVGERSVHHADVTADAVPFITQ